MRAVVERLLSRLWGRHWNAISRAEFRRYFGAKVVAILVALVLISYTAAVVTLILADRFSIASSIMRVILGLAWLIPLILVSTAIQKTLLIDRKLNVSEQWLLTPMRRRDLLVSRLAGMSAIAPMYVVTLFPLYVVGAAGLSDAQYGLFVIGHLARFFSAAPPHFSWSLASTDWFMAVPVALMALVCDLTTCVLASYAALLSSLQAVSWKRLFTNTGRAVAQVLELALWTVGMGLVMLAIEIAGAVVAGFYCYHAWEKTGAASGFGGLAVAAILCLVTLSLRLLMTRPHARLAGRYHDAVLLEDDPGTRTD